jgi:hypothetical protein
VTALPGNAAIPGASVPGAMQPGSITGGTVPSGYLYGGTEQLTYIDYIDTTAGHTLVATPGGGPYQIAPAGQGFNYGFAVPPPDGLWT